MAADPRSHVDSERPARDRNDSGGERAGSFGLSGAERAALGRADRAAMARLFDESFQPLYRYIARAAGDGHAAEDLVQDVYMILQRSISTYRPELPLRPWVFAIASNVLRKHYKKKGLERGVEDLDGLASRGEEPVELGDRPLTALSKEESARAVATALAELPPKTREVLVLRHYERLPFVTIAEITSTTVEASRQRYVRAIAELRKRLGPDLEPAEEVA